MSDLIRFSLTTVNAPDAIALARFYASVLAASATRYEHQPNATTASWTPTRPGIRSASTWGARCEQKR